MTNLTKWVHLAFLAAGVLAWVFLREILQFVFEPLGFARLGWVVNPPDLAGIAVGAGLFVFLMRFGKARDYTEAAFAELAKVVWPAKKESALSTGVVSVLVAVATLVVLFFDTLWNWVADKMLY